MGKNFNELALEMHREHQGKIETISRVKLEMLKQWIYVFIALMGAWTALSHFLKN